MKKQGYTLTESLVALTIIGVIAAVMLPLVSKYKPDPEKAMYIKAHDTLAIAIKSIVDDNKFLYPIAYRNAAGELRNVTRAPLLNTSRVANNQLEFDGGNQKLTHILAYALNATTDVNELEYVRYASDDDFPAPSFQIENGMQFWVMTNYNEDDANSFYQTDVYVDVNGNNGVNSMFNTKPDRFKFIIAADGTITAADEVGEAYLGTRTNWRRNLANLTGNNANLVNRVSEDELPEDLRWHIGDDGVASTDNNVAGNGNQNQGGGANEDDNAGAEDDSAVEEDDASEDDSNNEGDDSVTSDSGSSLKDSIIGTIDPPVDDRTPDLGGTDDDSSTGSSSDNTSGSSDSTGSTGSSSDNTSGSSDSTGSTGSSSDSSSDSSDSTGSTGDSSDLPTFDKTDLIVLPGAGIPDMDGGTIDTPVIDTRENPFSGDYSAPDNGFTSDENSASDSFLDYDSTDNSSGAGDFEDTSDENPYGYEEQESFKTQIDTSLSDGSQL